MSPTRLAEAGVVFGLAAGDERGDAALAGEPAVFVVVVATVGDKLGGGGGGAGPVEGAPHGWYPSRRRGDGVWSRFCLCRLGSGPVWSPLFRLPSVARSPSRLRPG